MACPRFRSHHVAAELHLTPLALLRELCVGERRCPAQLSSLAPGLLGAGGSGEPLAVNLQDGAAPQHSTPPCNNQPLVDSAAIY